MVLSNPFVTLSQIFLFYFLTLCFLTCCGTQKTFTKSGSNDLRKKVSVKNQDNKLVKYMTPIEYIEC